ncbi:hypothetical protein F4801DRAFT_601111 [Xylaria longipes]|nr:hypothetical protein F4801DRAFT_601111 [Xylaria longipes]
MAPAPKLSISCHCGAAKQTVRLRDQSSSAPQEINLCHCAACRHNTGLLCVSYAGIERPGSIEGLKEYHSTTEMIMRFFCATCGCHVFWKLQSPLMDQPHRQVEDGALATAEQKEWWAVATGVVIGVHGDGGEEPSDGDSEMLMRYAKHINMAGTGDGGLSLFIRNIGELQGLKVIDNQDPSHSSPPQPAKEKLEGSDLSVDIEAFSRGDEKEQKEGDVLEAFCHCRTVQFQITRPNVASKLPRSIYSDLIVPFHTGSPQAQNPEDNKWWLRPKLSCRSVETETTEEDQLTRYLAGTCACRSCRLTSVSRYRHSPTSTNEATDIVPLDFATLPPDILTSYESSQGVRREFCSRCGATVFWRDRWRPELIDVSAGLLDAAEGARAESWLDWWTGRVSFAEDAENGRTGETAKRARSLIEGLEDGLGSYHGQRQKGS